MPSVGRSADARSVHDGGNIQYLSVRGGGRSQYLSPEAAQKALKDEFLKPVKLLGDDRFPLPSCNWMKLMDSYSLTPANRLYFMLRCFETLPSRCNSIP